MPPFSVGLYLPQDVPPDTALRIAGAAEAGGLDSVWVPDHLHQFPDKNRGRLDAWSLLSAVAVETTRIRLGIGVCNVQLRNPRLLAKMASTLDTISAGRLMLALGTGGNAAELQAYGYPSLTGQEARARLVETIQALKQFATGEWNGAYCRPTPVQEPLPLAVAADHPATMRIAAANADWWYANLAPAERFAVLNARMTDACRAVKRDPDSVSRNAHVLTIIGSTQAEASLAAERYAAGARARLFEAPHILGDASTLATGLHEYAQAGANRACLYVLNMAADDGRNAEALTAIVAEAAASMK